MDRDGEFLMRDRRIGAWGIRKGREGIRSLVGEIEHTKGLRKGLSLRKVASGIVSGTENICS